MTDPAAGQRLNIEHDSQIYGIPTASLSKCYADPMPAPSYFILVTEHEFHVQSSKTCIPSDTDGMPE
nr:hypothetical protein CFP56_20665 [Quercus suber]